MKKTIKHLLSSVGWHIGREPRGMVFGYDLWRDLGILLQEKPLCFDIGANHGDVSAELLRIRPSATIHAFEPAPICQEKLKARFGNNDRIRLIPSGVGDRAGAAEFHHYANDQLSSFLPLDVQDNPFQNEPELTRQQIPVTTVDDYCAANGIGEIDLLKIDTQGFDLKVVQGSEKRLRAKAVKLVLIELNFIALYEGQAWGHEVMSLLHQQGFQLVDFYEKCRRHQKVAWCTALFAQSALALKEELKR